MGGQVLERLKGQNSSNPEFSHKLIKSQSHKVISLLLPEVEEEEAAFVVDILVRPR